MCRVLCRSTDWMFPSLSQVSFSGQLWNVDGKNDILRLFRWSYGGLCNMEVKPLNSAKSVLLTIQQSATQPPSFPFCSSAHLNVCRSRRLTIQYMFCGNPGNFRHHLSMFCLQATRLVVRYIVDGTPSNEFVFSVVTLPPCILHRMVVQQESARMSKLTVCILGRVQAEKLKTFQQLPTFLPLQSFIFTGTKYCLFQATLKDLKTSYLYFTLT